MELNDDEPRFDQV